VGVKLRGEHVLRRYENKGMTIYWHLNGGKKQEGRQNDIMRRSFVINYLQIEESKMGRICSTYEENEKFMQKFSQET
jgi:hypothetical protein